MGGIHDYPSVHARRARPDGHSFNGWGLGVNAPMITSAPASIPGSRINRPEREFSQANPQHNRVRSVPKGLAVSPQLYVVNVLVRTEQSSLEVLAALQRLAAGAIGLLHSHLEERGRVFFEFLAPKRWMVEQAVLRLCGSGCGVHRVEILDGRRLKSWEYSRVLMRANG